MKKSNRSKFLRSFLPALFLAAPLPASRTEPSPAKPNILFIFIDDLGWKDAGFMGSSYYETPNIDKLAGEGMVFTNAYSNGPNCAPSRASLLSGLYTPRHGVYTVGSPARGRARDRKLVPIPNRTTLDPGIVTLAESLKRAGYATGHFGKWHLGKDPVSGPRAQGFDVNVGGNRAGSPRRYFSPYRNPDLPDGPPGEYLTDRLTEEAVKFMKKNRAKPFFVYMSHYAVHTPIRAKSDLTARFKKKKPSGGHRNPVYAAMIASVDESVGRLLSTLDELGLRKRTIVVFFSDNGGFGPVTSMAPLRGRVRNAGSPFRESISIPPSWRLRELRRPRAGLLTEKASLRS